MINLHHAKHPMSALGDRIATAIVTAMEQQSAANPAERARWGGIAELLNDCQTRPAPELQPRITATIQAAIGKTENAVMQADYIRWKSLVRLLEDVRDAIAKGALLMPPPVLAVGKRIGRLSHLISGKRA
jgi:hypothetical protein